jgi:hypothetical protein
MLAQAVTALAAAREAASMEVCRAPVTSRDCDKLRELRDLLSWWGTDVNDVDLVLTQASPRLATLEDEEAFAEANVPRCAAPASENDCDKAAVYVEKFPNGAHLEEVKRAIAKGSPTIKRLAARREAQERAEEARRLAEERAEAARQRAAAAAERRSRPYCSSGSSGTLCCATPGGPSCVAQLCHVAVNQGQFGGDIVSCVYSMASLCNCSAN